MSSRETQQQLFQAFARVADGLAHGHRIALLELLAQGERDVETLAQHLALSVATVSQHLQRLKRAGLVVARREGRRQVYRLASPKVSGLLASLQRLAEECLVDVEKLVSEEIDARDAIPPVSAAELERLLESGQALLLDVRPAEEFAAGHIPGAINVPLERLMEDIESLPGNREIVVYCRGPYCMLTLDALEMLRARGLSVRRLEPGVPAWHGAGRPVEKNAPGDTPDA
jgi:rhodanese-related sulfurtransferase/predicted transcriptional regulator